MNWFDDWALTLAVFLPVVGMVIILLIPKAEETAEARRAPHHARDARRRRRDPAASTTTAPGSCSSGVNEPWIDVIHSRYHLGIDGISLPLLLLSMLVTVAVRHLLVEPLPRAAQPEGVPRADPPPRGRDERHVPRRGPDPLLHVLRGRAAPDVLHDRRLGRAEPRVRVDQVLPVHAVRLRVDAAGLPGALLPRGHVPDPAARPLKGGGTSCGSPRP